MQAIHKKITGAGILSLCFFLCLQAQAQNWRIFHYTVERGLPHEVCYDLHQDHLGYMWIGTDLGLVRFNGKEFTTFSEADGLEAQSIITIGETPQGELWCSAYEEGLFFKKKDRFEPAPFETKDTWYHPTLYYDERGGLIMHDLRLDLYSGFCEYKSRDQREYFMHFLRQGDQLKVLAFDSLKANWKSRYKFQKFQKYDDGKISHLRIWRSPEAQLLLATNTGVFVMDARQQPLPFHAGLEGKAVWALHGDKVGNIVFAGADNIYCLNKHRKMKSFALPPGASRIAEVLQGPQQTIYLLEEDHKRIWALDIPTGTYTPLHEYTAISVAISHIEVDHLGGLWVSTDGDGCYVFRQNLFQNTGVEAGLRNLFINDFWVEEEQLWVAHKKGLQAFNMDPKRKLSLATPNPLIQREVFRIKQSPKGEIFACGWDGIYHISTSVEKFLSLTHPDFTFHPNGGLIILTTNNLILANKPEITQTYLENSPKGFFNNYIFEEDEDYNLYWANNQAVQFMRHGPEQPTSMKVLSKTGARALHTGFSGKIFFAHEDSLFIYRPHQAIQAFRLEKEKLGIIHQIAEDRNGDIWLGTTSGLHRWAPEATYTFLKNNGLISNNITKLHVDQKNRLWIGTSKGISMLAAPEKLQKSAPPNLYVQAISLNGEAIDSIGDKPLPPQSSLSLTFDVVELQSAQQVFHQFRLTDQEAWQDVAGPFLTLSNLQPQRYQLEFRVRSPQSDWGEAQKFAFEIRPPLWQKWWMILILILGIGLLSSLIAISRIRNIRKKAAAQTALNQQMAHLQLSALQSQLNPHFMFNALNAIQYFIFNHDEIAANDYLAKFSRLMRLFLEASNKRYISLAEEIELLENYIELEQMRFEGKFEYNIQIDLPFDLEGIEIPSMMLQPYVENAINHGLVHRTSPGNLFLSFTKNENCLIILIEDDGIGRKKAREMRAQESRREISRGMQLLADRLQVLKEMGAADIQTKVEDLYDENHQAKGTRVKICFPI